jgi:hypothetical protein
MTNNPIWLVEIRVKDWVANLPTLANGRTVHYVEVEAGNEIAARHAGFDEFQRLVKFNQIVARMWKDLNLDFNSICAPEAIIMEE